MFTLAPKILTTTIVTTGLVIYFKPYIRNSLLKLIKNNTPNTLVIYNTRLYNPYMIFTIGVFSIIIISGFIYVLLNKHQPYEKIEYITDPLLKEYETELRAVGFFKPNVKIEYITDPLIRDYVIRPTDTIC
jgi:hypothetical protein